MISLGIDIGLSGAIALVSGPDLIALEDMPTREKSGKGLIRREIDARALYELLLRILGDNHDKLVVHLENVYGMRKGEGQRPQGSASVFSFGDTRGAIRAVLEMTKLEHEWVAPQSWKRHFKLNSDKGAARARALELYPAAGEKLARVKDHNRAESLLIARYGYERYA